jgi:GNAT superfamily N-acetyltransferase
MISHRPATPDDVRFVVSAWSSSYKQAHTAGMIHTDDWATVMHRQVERALARPGSRTLVAFEHKDTSHIYGFICGDTSDDVPAIFYVYVKEPYRRSGIARDLFKALGVQPHERFIYACKTAIVPTLARSIPAARFNPAILRYPKERRA